MYKIIARELYFFIILIIDVNIFGAITMEK